MLVATSIMNATQLSQEAELVKLFVHNRIVHDAWYLDQKQGVAAQFKSYPAKDFREVDLKLIEETIEKIERLTEKSIQLFEEINTDVGATRKR
jgi:hypothetical protein